MSSPAPAWGGAGYPGTGTGDFVIPWGDFSPSAIAVDTRATSQTVLVGINNPGGIKRTLDATPAAPTWTSESGIPTSDAIVSICFAASVPGMAYAASASGVVYRKDDVNGGATWTRLGQWNVTGVVELAVNHHQEDRLYLATGSQVARSEDAGSTWILIPGAAGSALPTSGINSLIAHPGNAETLIVGADSGVYLSIDEGQTWSLLDGLPSARVLEIFWTGSYLYAVLIGRGVWRCNPLL